jgi:membrane protein YdbS with pleckstrin-like domain
METELEAGGDPALEPVEPGYKHVLRVRMLVFWLVLWAGGLVLDQAALSRTVVYGLPTFAIPILAAIAVVTAPDRIYRRLRYGLTERLLQVVRGWLFHVDTVVPLVRVQHIDVTRGPLEKMFGVATLVVHTAGTHNSIVTLPGLAPERAAQIRDIIREHVRTDFA